MDQDQCSEISILLVILPQIVLCECREYVSLSQPEPAREACRVTAAWIRVTPGQRSSDEHVSSLAAGNSARGPVPGA